ncbi:hypothetical protein GQ44DRAFT_829304 [Phaeosphaeriaceae sp. PMI808]|nr:hypothetical protein GQ44DRAFT_829304 [Phaeosphaeriaceae sp. PMI808]
MSGIEVVALVAAIVSAFTGTASYLKGRKKRKIEKAEKKKKELSKLQDAVVLAPPKIQREYNRDVARIGPKFASGDAVGREQLSTILIEMQ